MVVQSGTKDASPSKNAIPCIVPVVGIHQHVFLLKTMIQCRILILKYPFAHGKAVLTRIPHLTPLPPSSPFKNEYTLEQLLPPAYVVRREGVLTRVCPSIHDSVCPQGGGGSVLSSARGGGSGPAGGGGDQVQVGGGLAKIGQQNE